jgi:predicted CXXCH cytochrome family protein
MNETRKNSATRAWLFLPVAVLTLAAHLAFAQKQPAVNDPSSVSWRALPAGQPGDYVGQETCAACHRVRAELLAKTPHHRIAVAGVSMAAACEACHGPGKAHAEGEKAAESDSSKGPAAKKLIFGFHGTPEENAARCLACHGSSRSHDVYNNSEHKLQGISCEECHAPHLVMRDEARERTQPSLAQVQFFSAPRLTEQNRWLNQSLLRKSQPDLCFTCHRTIQAQFALPTHHRVPEGLMKCTDCHNPHGTLNGTMLKKVKWEACVRCHVEKRGPFVFEHPSVKIEGCVICHSPHGSVNRNLLLRGEGRFLCLQCHVNPFAQNVPHSRLGYQTRGECVRCHAVIHGSNSSDVFLR